MVNELCTHFILQWYETHVMLCNGMKCIPVLILKSQRHTFSQTNNFLKSINSLFHNYIKFLVHIRYNCYISFFIKIVYNGREKRGGKKYMHVRRYNHMFIRKVSFQRMQKKIRNYFVIYVPRLTKGTLQHSAVS